MLVAEAGGLPVSRSLELLLTSTSFLFLCSFVFVKLLYAWIGAQL